MSQPATPSAAETPSTENNTASTAPTPYSPDEEAPKGGEVSTASRLEQICLASVAAVNQRDFEYKANELHTHISPVFRAQFDNFPHQLTMPEHSNLLRQAVQEFPDYHVQVRSISSKINEQAGTGTVFMETEVTGAPPAIRTVSMNEYKWRKERGEWKCHLHTGMKGMSDFN